MKQSKIPRPPIVAILGHVDHGKTTLLDAIRKTNLASREAGGITQSIGAWQVEARGGKKITFIDTPGHEAFQAMRSRGAKVADLVVLVVAADDGVMPQTRESLQYIREGETPFMVAITKTDLEAAQPENARKQLAEEGVLLEGQGGDVVAVEVSGKTGKGIDELLEMILLLAEMNEVTENAAAKLEAPVIETEVSRKGPVVRAVIRDGTLRVGDEVEAGGVQARVRGLFDESQKPVKEVLPGIPVEVLGFSKLPPVGSILQHAREHKEEPQVAAQRRKFGKIEGFPIVLKADTAGSLEALEAKLAGDVVLLAKGVGDINENDLQLAQPISAPVIGFNVRAPKEIRKFAEEEGVPVHTYKIIYELLQDVEAWIKEREEQGREKILGRAEILAEFPHGKKKIAGCKVIKGRIAKQDRLRLVRGEEVLGKVRPISMKKQKAEVNETKENEEFGILFEPQLDFKIGDVIESFRSGRESFQSKRG